MTLKGTLKGSPPSEASFVAAMRPPVFVLGVSFGAMVAQHPGRSFLISEVRNTCRGLGFRGFRV